MFTFRIPCNSTRIISKGYHFWVPGLISIILEMVCVPLSYRVHSANTVDVIYKRIGINT